MYFKEMQNWMGKDKIYLASPHMSAEGYEQAYVGEAFATNWIAPLGANVNGFEEELAEKVGVKSAAALSSGTAAIHLALKSLELVVMISFFVSLLLLPLRLILLGTKVLGLSLLIAMGLGIYVLIQVI